MTPREYLDQIVTPNMDEYRSAYSDLRRAINATATVHALPAHIFYWLEATAPGALSFRNDDEYRTDLAAGDQDFKLVHDVALGIKHVSLQKPTATIDGASSMGVNTVGFGVGVHGAGRYGGPPQVIITLKDGSEKMLEDALNRSLVMLEARMTGFGL